MKIDELDTNLKTNDALGLTDAVYADVRGEPFDLYGLYDPKNGSRFRRLPDAVGEAVNPRVRELSFFTAGGRVRFSTDSPYIAIRCVSENTTVMPHMTICGSAGFDLYQTVSGTDRYVGSFLPPVTMSDGTYATYRINAAKGYSSFLSVGEGGMRSYTVHFPLYNDVVSLMIGLKKGSEAAHGAPYRPVLPIVYYGSSITEGGCASRPGNAYTNLISEQSGIDHINLGFSGSALGEPSMADYIASLSCSALVMDYDFNAPDPAHLAKTHEPFYRRIREKRPDLPILMLSKPTVLMTEENLRRRDIIAETFRKARDAGDENVYFLDGSRFFTGSFADACTVDTVHPNDAGFVLMAQAVGELLRNILK